MIFQLNLKINETIDICNPGKTKNIFVCFYIPHALKSLKPEFKCPLFGEYRWETDLSADLGADFAFVPPIIKNLKTIVVHLNVIVYTIDEDDEKIILIDHNEFLKVNTK
ncbi:hypothetical protein PVAND_015011 [Polypedilum vanderplanki]|uniref:Uncharacterized protein n=1 Tax=Polypedilum vanderplanki TaxID=319348 RepID=A0A9J6BBR5_POLVA|nr:hypothetical protein PVAND_015011 [Polypedilum vanderplanki]